MQPQGVRLLQISYSDIICDIMYLFHLISSNNNCWRGSLRLVHMKSLMPGFEVYQVI